MNYENRLRAKPFKDHTVKLLLQFCFETCSETHQSDPHIASGHWQIRTSFYARMVILSLCVAHQQIVAQNFEQVLLERYEK